MVEEKKARKTVQKTVQKTVLKTAPKTAHKVVHGTAHRASSITHGVGRWLWQHKKPILVSTAWLVVGTMLGSVRVIPPPSKLNGFGLFRIAK